MHRIHLTLSILLGSASLGAQQPNGAPVLMDGLPGYYEFFMKTGKLVELEAEQARNRRIDAGEYLPIAVNADLPGFKLPDAKGEELDFLSYRGQRSLVIVSFRSWW